MTRTEYWVSPTNRRRDGIPAGGADNAAFLRETHGLNVFAVMEAEE